VAHDDYRGGAVTETMASANAEGFLIAQIETAAGVEQAEAIAAVDGIDCLWVGHFDLTQSLGIPAQFDHPAFQRAVDRVLAACAKHGKAAGIMGGDVASSRQWLARGFRAVAYSGDLWIYGAALAEGVAELKRAAGGKR
jgi:2-dehydro-3-deoxyglucarate aldolase/4-hydroxy-2-oxoheptanedioate aldolase